MALRVRTLLTSATFRLYSGAEKEAPIDTLPFLLEQTQKQERNVNSLLFVFVLRVVRNPGMYTCEK